MTKKKVMVIVGTRPEIIRLAETIKKIDQYFDLTLVHTGQNYDHNLNQVFFEELELREPDYYLDSPGDTLGSTVGNIIARSYEVMAKEKPSALLVLGDTNSCLAAYSAKRLKIPIFHMEAGNRCFDFNTPEEINRRVVDHLSDINLTYSKNAKQYLISEGKTRDEVFVTGSPMTELIAKYTSRIDDSNILEKLNIEAGKYFVVSLHREENLDIGENFRTVCNTLNAVAEKYNMPLIFSTHPRTQKRIETEDIRFNELIKSMPAMGFFDYNKLQKNAFCVLSDSGTICEESTIQHFPAISVRTSQERPEGLDGGTLILGGVEQDDMFSAIDIATSASYEDKTILVPDYRDVNVSDKVLRIIQSYTSIVDSRTWHKK